MVDLRHVRGWVLTMFFAALVVSTVATYMLVFAVADGRNGILTTRPPRQPASFLRVIDPRDSIVRVIESERELEASILDAPGLRILTDRMHDDDRMFMVLPLNALIYDFRTNRQVDTDPQAIVGAAPRFLPQAPARGTMTLWGSLEDGAAPVPGVNDHSVAGYPVQQVSSRRLSATYVSGGGLVRNTADTPTVAMDVTTARDLGVTSPPGVPELLSSFTCYCDVVDLDAVAEEMSQAESRAGTGRTYYAVDRAGLVGPVQRSQALSGALGAGQAITTLLSIGWLAIVLARLYWSRRAPTYLVERLCGSGELALQMRAQVLLAASLTVPAIAGYEVVDALLSGSTAPPPLPPGTRVAAFAVIGMLHAAAGLPTVFRVHRLCRFETDELRRL